MRRAGWTEKHVEALVTGVDWFGDLFHGGTALNHHDTPESIARRRECWEDLKDSILADFILAKPFHRPAAWWEFDAPEYRRCINDVHPFEDPERIAYVAQVELQYPGQRDSVMRLMHGLPTVWCGPDFDHRDRKYESERDYLKRLGLLTGREKELLSPE